MKLSELSLADLIALRGYCIKMKDWFEGESKIVWMTRLINIEVELSHRINHQIKFEI